MAGLSAAMAASPTLFVGLKWLGTAFLVYLGVRTILTGRGPRGGRGPARPRRP